MVVESVEGASRDDADWRLRIFTTIAPCGMDASHTMFCKLSGVGEKWKNLESVMVKRVVRNQ